MTAGSGFLGMGAPERTPSRERSAWVVVAVVALVIAGTYGDYGITWDEGVQSAYGDLALAYFGSGFHDRTCNEFLNLHLYGPLVEMLPAGLGRVAGRESYDARHLVLGILGLLSLPGVIVLVRGFRLPHLALLSCLALVLQPRFFGHWFNNSKDVPFAVALIALFAGLASMFLAPRRRPRHLLACGLAMAAALGVRPGGFPLLAAYLGGVLVVARLTLGARRRHRIVAADVRPPDGLPGRSLLRDGLRVAGIAAIGWAGMVLPWPWAHESPIGHPIEAMRAALAFPESYPILFEGALLPSDGLPRYYLVKFLAIATPPSVLLLAAIGAIRGVREQRRSPHGDRAFLHGLLQLWIAIPLLGFIVLRPNAYDGLRHFLFLLPPLAILAALGGVTLLGPPREDSSGRSRGRRSSARAPRRLLPAAVVAVLLLSPLRAAVRLHPYEMTYFNFLVGGVRGAQERYQTDYWVASYREGMQWINGVAARRPDRVLRVLVSGSIYVLPAAATYRAPNVEVVTLEQARKAGIRPGAFDYYLCTTRAPWNAAVREGTVVHTVGRAGARFSEVRRLSG